MDFGWLYFDQHFMPLNLNYFFGTPEITHARFVPGAPISGYPNNDRGVYPPFPQFPGIGPI
jgi:hypothetical protein